MSELERLKQRLSEIDGDIDLCRELNKATALAGLHRLAVEIDTRVAALERALEEDRLAHLGDEELVAMLTDNIKALPEQLQVRLLASLQAAVDQVT